MRRIHVFVRGRVQGVFFRASCARRARDLDVAGWVRNAEDGLVEAEFEGEDAAVEAILAWCREGPPYADVTSVQIESREPTGQTGFRTTR